MTPRFVPHPFLRGAHRQTVGAAYLWRRRPRETPAHFITLPDGDQVVLHDYCPAAWSPGQRVVLMLHGLAGCHQSGYMHRVSAKLAAEGYRAFRLDMRGCGAGRHLARYSAHAGRTQDVQETVEWIAQRCPGSPVTLVGFSLGAAITLKWLGVAGDLIARTVDSAIAIAPPLDLADCCRRIRQGWNRLYDRNFVRVLSRTLAERKRVVASLAGFDRPFVARSLYDFDTIFTAPMGGFASVDDYYEQCSCTHELSRIQIPTRVLFAEDDPLIHHSLFAAAQFSESTQVFATRHGGHLGYLADRRSTQPRDPDWHWLDWRVVDWVQDFAAQLGAVGGPARHSFRCQSVNC